MRRREFTAAGLGIAAGALARPALAQDSGPIRIGVLTDMSGQFADQSGEGAVAAMRMAVQDCGGQLLGRPIEVVVADHQNRPDVAVARAREWYDRGGVHLIGNLINSAVALAVAGVARERNRIAIVNGSGSSRITNEGCTPNSIHYAYDTVALARGTANALLREGKTSWFFLTADYAFGHALESDTTDVVRAAGGRVAGTVRYPVESADLSSFLLRAQGSGAEVVAIAGSGTVFINAVKAAHEFGLRRRQTVVGLLTWLPDVHALGLQVAQGMVLTNGFYWDRDDATRAWAQRFFAVRNRMPHMGDAGDYSSTMHYLRAVQAAGTLDAAAVMAKMRDTPIADFFAAGGRIRADGRMVHDMYVYEVKRPEESARPWDYYKLRATIPAAEAYRPLAQSACPLVRPG
ncbi:ABC transporter substrate-binding protein [Roseomonas hellenica]|uniref:ABC transporter substrate-binding protein n=1 Tax=Plastoroseomonas hellenica TaxID=2687306 RepID=A0ABS5F7T1_9PROT|nr:ABC transporter substrate-binding protein [Plastoroseomonas hellenica]MBR0668630.1 ABC transporter substrate-binding protein [Plastoroseomonas hellenica]